MTSELPDIAVAETLANKIAALKPGVLPTETLRKCEDLLIDIVGLCVTARNEDYVKAALGGCDDDGPKKSYKAWTRQHPAIGVAAGDFVSDNGREVYSLLKQRGIKNLLVMGVHTNMCVLNRSFAIKQMTRWGVRCALIRDLTDTMYNPKKRPFVAHEKGTELVVEHIEKYWCPSVLSSEWTK